MYKHLFVVSVELHSQTRKPRRVLSPSVCYIKRLVLSFRSHSAAALFSKRLVSLVCVTQVTEISMGEFLLHSTVVWLNPHPSLGRMRKDPEMTVFGKSAHSSCHRRCCIMGEKDFPTFSYSESLSTSVLAVIPLYYTHCFISKATT